MLFEPTPTPRVFYLPPGVDFGKAFVGGLLDRAGSLAPDHFARAEIYLNTQRMQRHVTELLSGGPPRLLPRIGLVSDLGAHHVFADIPPPASALRQRLELSQLVARLIDTNADLAPRAALYDLTDSLADLLDEIQSEGVSVETVLGLDVSDHSEHWHRAQEFIRIAQHFTADTRPDCTGGARQRLVVERLLERWQKSPPSHPVIVAGSTGSRGATAVLMAAVARLPQGAVVLPGFDNVMPADVWQKLGDSDNNQDHPQYRFKSLLDALDLAPSDVVAWTGAVPPSPARNTVVSLALRSAPVTDQWLRDGPRLGDLVQAMQDVTLVEADSPREEAEAIATGMRAAIGEGKTVALISPDRNLTRRVQAALDRWDILPDDSAGQPLHLSPPGRFLRHVAETMGQKITAEALLVLLKHPLTNSGSADRGMHLLRTRELELHFRRYGPPFPDAQALANWAAKGAEADPARADWANWISQAIFAPTPDRAAPLRQLISQHLALAQTLAQGPLGEGSGLLWDEEAGREADKQMQEFLTHADAGGHVDLAEYISLFSGILSQAQVRNPDLGRADILILGTLEARVQCADLVILGGLNEGVWPQSPTPDPWLNRQMRRAAGLLLPERQTGLAAHDFQQAIGAPEVWLCRAVRSDEAETVPSRWINRLLNLLRGLEEQGGKTAVEQMTARGKNWLATAAKIAAPEHPVTPACRPSPQPPLAARPKEITVTEVKTLVCDPYAVYARRVLGLNELDPLAPTPDAPLKGIIIHRILERFVFEPADGPPSLVRLLAIAEEEFIAQCPWPTIRELWIARFRPAATWFVETETARLARATPRFHEAKGGLGLDELGLRLVGRADRIDINDDGAAILYDYKTGALPTGPEQVHTDKQLLLQAAMIERGGYADVGTAMVADAAFIGIGSNLRTTPAPFKTCPIDDTWSGFVTLMQRWQDVSRGYSARMALLDPNKPGRYDHLARYGEWDLTTPATPERLE